MPSSLPARRRLPTPTRGLAGLVTGTLLVSSIALWPAKARALDITSYVASTVFFVRAATLKEVLDEGRGDQDTEDDYETSRMLGFVFLAAGLTLDAVALLLLVAISDRVESLEAELTNGGGPMIDAYGEAFGLSRAEVLVAVRAATDAYARTGDPADFDAELLPRLFANGGLSDEAAQRVLQGLYQERELLGSDGAHWHGLLSGLSGVPVSELAPTIAAPIDAHLARFAQPGLVVSARGALAQGAPETLRAVLEGIYDAHTDTLQARIDLVTGSGGPGVVGAEAVAP